MIFPIYKELATCEEIIVAGVEIDVVAIVIAALPKVVALRGPNPIFAKIPMGVEAIAPVIP
jgi:hypothetical protein